MGLPGEVELWSKKALARILKLRCTEAVGRRVPPLSVGSEAM